MNNKGYSTIEAVIIIPIILSIILLLVWLGFFLYDKNVLSQAASRAAVCGSQMSYLENEVIADYVSGKVAELTDGKLILLDSAETTVTVTATNICVNVTGSMNIPDFIILGNVYNGGMWNIDIKEYGARLKNSMFIRTANRIKNLKNNQENEQG